MLPNMEVKSPSRGPPAMSVPQLLRRPPPSFEETALAIRLCATKSPRLPQPNLHWRELTFTQFPYLFWLVLVGAAVLTGFSAAALVRAVPNSTRTHLG